MEVMEEKAMFLWIRFAMRKKGYDFPYFGFRSLFEIDIWQGF
jgi:hypothetical protein